MATSDGGPAAAARERPRHEVADVFRRYGDAYRQTHRLPTSALRVMYAIQTCRTAALGGHLERCTDCGFERPAYNSCRNRHCPKCQSLAKAQWLDARQAELLPVDYFHTVFTLPHDLNPLILANKACLYQILFEAVADTLLTFGADPRHRLGGQLGFLAIPHTWDQQLRFHVHLHCVVPGGALDVDGHRWVSARPTFLFPVRALSRAFRRRVLTRLEAAWREQRLVFPTSLAARRGPTAFRAWLAALARKEWVVYAKPPFGGPATVLDYLARYTHRVAISNHRLTTVADGHVSFTYRDRQHGGVLRTLTLPAESFIDRLLLHVLPPRFLRIRHVGFLANRTKQARLAQCRRLLHAAPAPASAPTGTTAERIHALTGLDPLICPHCHTGTMVTIDHWTAGRPRLGDRPVPRLEDSS
jgi:predicted Zn-ribbon and HTH transcriptional regulator